MEPKEGVYISPAYEAVRESDDDTIECGRGPEAAHARKEDNPNWLRNRAANYIALAEWIEGAGRRRAEEAHRLNKRRDELAKELNGGGIDAAYDTWAGQSMPLRAAIDRIIELESAS